MGTFEYQALNSQGRKVRGIVEGDTPRLARQNLREQGLTPIQLDSVDDGAKTGRGFHFGGPRLKVRDLSLFTRQLATLVQSSMPLEEALGAASRQADKNDLRRIIASLRGRVLEGLSLAAACETFPKAFPPLYRATVAAGESSGRLGEVMERLADHLERKEEVRQKVQIALIYPLLLTVLSLLIVIGLLTYVVPQIVTVFENLGQALPTLTQYLINTSAFLRKYGAWLLIGLIGAAVLFRLMLKLKKYRFALHRLLLKLPLIGRFSKSANAARFTRTLAILTSSRVDLLTAMDIAGQVVPNQVIRDAVEEATLRVREGASLSRSLERSELFPPITTRLIASGESSGQLDKMLERAADNQERELSALTEIVVGIFEPVLILFMGGVILTIVIAILLPIFEMNQLVS